MTDLTITATQVLPDAAGTVDEGLAAVAITAGQTVYLDTAVGLYRPADSNASAATAVVRGIALNGAAAGQPVRVQTSGSPVLGAAASVVVGTIYVQSTNPGGIAPAADLVTGARVSILGVGIAGNAIKMGLNNTAVLVP